MYKLAIHGKKNSGKDTSAKIFKKAFQKQNFYLRQTSFAYPIKKIALEFLGFDKKRDCPNLFNQSHLRDEKIPGYEITYRDLCKKIGALGKEIDPEIWIKKVCINSGHYYDNVIISDLRYLNELNYLKQNDFKLIKIVRNNIDKEDLETDLDDYNDWDFIIDNNGTRDNLRTQIYQITNKILLNTK